MRRIEVGVYAVGLRGSLLLLPADVLALCLSFSGRKGAPGAARQPLTFFAPPKKVSKERRPLPLSPFGVPAEPRGKMGKEASRYAPASFLIHFSAQFSGWAEADFRFGSPAALPCVRLAFGLAVLAARLRHRCTGSLSDVIRHPGEGRDPVSFVALLRIPFGLSSRLCGVSKSAYMRLFFGVVCSCCLQMYWLYAYLSPVETERRERPGSRSLSLLRQRK